MIVCGDVCSLSQSSSMTSHFTRSLSHDSRDLIVDNLEFWVHLQLLLLHYRPRHHNMPLYLLRVSLQHPTFRLPSLKSVADLYEFPLKFVSEDRYRSALVVELRNDQDAMRFAKRGTMVMYVTSAAKP